MRVLLVNPQNLHGRNYVVIPNVSLGYLASSCLREGHDVTILDCVKNDLPPEAFADFLRANPQDVVGFNTFTPAMSAVRAYARVTQTTLPAADVILGGPHPTFEPIDTLAKIPQARFAFVGEAEEGLPRLLEAMAGPGPEDDGALDGIPGLVRRVDGQVIVNPRSLVDDLDRNGIPAWSLVRPDTYPVAPNGIFSRSRHIAPIIATRGCPYPCTFCGAGKALGKKVRKRSTENLVAEIDLLSRDYGVREIHIMDDNFTFDSDYAASFCEALMKRKDPIFWALPNGVRLDSLDEPLLRLMERSGCYSMAVGIESGNQHVLDHIKKRLTVEEVEAKIRLIKGVSGIKVTGFFILGYPTETRHDMERTIRFAMGLPIDRANFFNYTPFPGSEVYETLKEAGSIEGLDYDDLYIHNISFSPPGISRAEMLSFPRRAHLKFYLRPRILWNLAREVKSLDQVKVILSRARAILVQKTA